MFQYGWPLPAVIIAASCIGVAILVACVAVGVFTSVLTETIHTTFTLEEVSTGTLSGGKTKDLEGGEAFKLLG